MQLSYDNILFHLLERGFVTPASTVAGGVEIIEISSRNKNFIVCKPGGPNYFIKQTNEEKPQAKGFLFREASLYRQLFQEADTAKLQTMFPAFVEYDTGLDILVVDYVENSANLKTFQEHSGHFPPEVAFQLGANLAQVHVPAESLSDTSFMPRAVPWILSIHHTNFASTQHHHSNLWIAEIVQEQREFHPHLDALHKGWRRECLIHGDIKWDNCLLAEDNRLFFVDWETADIGDAAWDVGAVLHALLTSWIMSMPLDPLAAEGDGANVTQENYPIDTIQPAIHAFWRGYLSAGTLQDEADEFLQRSVGYAAARMVQTAFEQTCNAPQVTAHALTLLQVSSNILQEPRRAITFLLGL